MKQCGIIYATIKGMLGKDMYLGNANDPNVLVEMLQSCLPAANKDRILNSFQSVDGSIKLLIATIAFGTGVDYKGVTEWCTMDHEKCGILCPRNWASR